MTGQPLVVLTTLGSPDDARKLVRSLVEAKLVACGNIVPGVVSVYRWEGAVQEEPEVLVVLKTTTARWDGLQEAVRQRHPYQVPELLALPAAHVAESYLAWLLQETAG